MIDYNDEVFKGFMHISNAIKDANNRIENSMEGKGRFFITRWGSLNKIINGFTDGELVCIASRPGVGKSTFINLLLQDIHNYNLNPYDDLITTYGSFEMPAYQQIFRYYSNHLKIPSKKFKNINNPITLEEFEQLKNFGKGLAKLPIFIRDIPVSPYKWFMKMVDIIKKYPNSQLVIVVDHTRLFNKDAKIRASEEERLTELMTYLNILKNMGCLVFVLSQMNRDQEKTGDRRLIGTNRPVMADIFGASSIEQYCSTIIMLHRPALYDLKKYMDRPSIEAINGDNSAESLWLHIPKQREGSLADIRLCAKYSSYTITDEYYDKSSGDLIPEGNIDFSGIDIEDY